MTWYADGVDGDAAWSLGPASLAAAAVSRGLMVEGSLKKSSSLEISDEKPVLKSNRIRFLIMFADTWQAGAREEYKMNPSRYAAII